VLFGEHVHIAAMFSGYEATIWAVVVVVAGMLRIDHVVRITG
jgi:hypothetical protein